MGKKDNKKPDLKGNNNRMNDKDAKKAEKAILQQQKSGVFRDRKGRIFYIDPKTNETYRLNHGEDSFIYLYDAKILFALLPLAISFSFANLNIIIMGTISVAIYFGFILYYKLKVLKGLHVATSVPAEVTASANSLAVLKSKRTDFVLKFMMGFLVLIIIATSLYEARNANEALTTLTLVGYTISVFMAALVVSDQFLGYLKVNKQIRNAKRTDKIEEESVEEESEKKTKKK